MLQTDLGKRAADFGLGRAVVGGGTGRVVRGTVGAGGAVVAGRAVGAGGAVVGVE